VAETAIVWFRRDLRLADNPALHHALRLKIPVIPVYIHAPEAEAPWQPGAASRYWLHRSLQVLDGELHARGSRLILGRGDPETVLARLARQCSAGHVYLNRLYEPVMLKLERRIQRGLKQAGVRVRSFPGHLLNEPDEILTAQGTPFKVFTPYWRRCLQRQTPAATLPAPGRLPAPSVWPASEPLSRLELKPAVKWYAGIDREWTPGCAGARRALRRFSRDRVQHYPQHRDYPSAGGVSRLSPYLHFGEVSPAQVAGRIVAADRARGLMTVAGESEAFLRQLYWRDFAHYLLYHFPRTPTQPLYEKFRRFPWRRNRRLFSAWRRGLTGYPIVDAGMRELWETGWMHNRARMIAASFLVKDLLIHWREGARWFWDTLVDADLANNTLGWQWTAGCGADAAPFFRIFNPVTQGEKFDPDGAYVRRWVPELAALDSRFIHKPWRSPAAQRRGYPDPVVDHQIARKAALAAFRAL
jgi:deoxyribodipyrimidine photo-lyase